MGGKGTHDERSYFPADVLAISYNGRTLERGGKILIKPCLRSTESLGSKISSLLLDSLDPCPRSVFTDTENAVTGTDEGRRRISGCIS